MKTYVNRRPPGLWKIPDHPVIVLNEEESQHWHKGWLSIRGEVRQRAIRALQKHSYYTSVAIYDESGQELQVISRED